MTVWLPDGWEKSPHSMRVSRILDWTAGRGVGTGVLREEEVLRWVPTDGSLAIRESVGSTDPREGSGLWKNKAPLKAGCGWG